MTPQPIPTMDDVLLDVAGICDYLGKSRETIRRWSNTRGLPLHRVTRTSAYARKSEIDTWLLSHGLQPAQAQPVEVVAPQPRAQRIIALPQRKRPS